MSLPAGPTTPSPALPGIPVAYPPGVSIELTVGAVTISTWFSALFCGIILTLGYVYFLQFPNDRLAFKLIAGAAVFVSVMDTVANMVWAHEWTVKLWGSILGTGIIPHGFYINILAASLSCLLTQCFFAWRLWRVSKNRLLVGVIVTGSVMQLAVVIWVFSQWAQHPLFVQFGDVLPTAYIWIVAPVVSDLAISGAMIYYLRVRTGATPTTSRLSLNGIILRTVQCNVFALISQILTTIFMNVEVGMYFFLNDVTITKVYAFSLLISLISRKSQVALFGTSQKTSTVGNQISLNNLQSNQRFGTMARNGPVVHVTENISVHGDEEWESQGERKAHFSHV